MELVNSEKEVEESETSPCEKVHLTKAECMALLEIMSRCPLKGNEAPAFTQLGQRIGQAAQSAE